MSEGVPNFLNFHSERNKGYCVPLPILGRPKPSAWEFYLRQDGKNNTPPATYGDLPGEGGGDLAGRKYYRHQTYEQAIDNIKKGKGTDEKGKPIVQSDQATLARFICDKGTRFTFAIRFARLREWELGALIAALEPQHFGDEGKTYAHKLGLGRPLGMGSVKIVIDEMRIRKESETVLPQQDNRAAHEQAAIDALKEKLPSPPPGWLKMHEYPEEMGKQVGYPTAKTTIKMNKGEKKEIDAIYAWHTNRRREYSVRRREKEPNWRALCEPIQKAKGGEC